MTPDGRYFVHKERLWRCTNPTLDEDARQTLVNELMTARRDVGKSKRKGNIAALSAARSKVHAAKVSLGERGPTWWDDDTDFANEVRQHCDQLRNRACRSSQQRFQAPEHRRTDNERGDDPTEATASQSHRALRPTQRPRSAHRPGKQSCCAEALAPTNSARSVRSSQSHHRSASPPPPSSSTITPAPARLCRVLRQIKR